MIGGVAVGLVRYLCARDRGAVPEYVRLSGGAVRSAGGVRVYGGALDGGSSRALRFDALLVDELPSRDAADEVLHAEEGARAAVGDDAYALAVAPAPRWVLRALVPGAAWLARTFRARSVEEPPEDVLAEVRGEPGMEDDAALERFRSADPRRSLVVMNLLAYRERARYDEPIRGRADVDGATAYRRYGRNTMPHVFRRGGRPLYLGRPLARLLGAADDPLSDDWDTFALVYYPSRVAMRDMLADPQYRRGHAHRRAGLARTLVMPGTPWPDWDPGR